MKTAPLIAFILVITVCSCEKVITDTNLRPLTDAPTGPPQKAVDTVKPVAPAPDTSVVPTPPFPQQTINNNNNNGNGSGSTGSGSGSTGSGSTGSGSGNTGSGSTGSGSTGSGSTGSGSSGSGTSGSTGSSGSGGGTTSQTTTAACPIAPIYGDTIVYPQPTSGSDYIIYPINTPGPGKYFSWPAGMVLNQNTGAIDLTASQTGMRYVMGYVQTGTTDTCVSNLIVGGAAYYDSVYVLGDGQTTASPYFEANGYLPNICVGGGCTFDVGGKAAAQKVVVNTVTGVIDLQQTLNGPGGLAGLLGGAFGLLPTNGSTFTTTIYYKLNDPSNQALQNIQVQLEYFDSKSSVSAGLLGGIVNQLNNLLSGNILSTGANPRPPLVIITRRD
jgi:hypothetical protein